MLQIYPGERHSLRHVEASEHYETTLLAFLKANLWWSKSILQRKELTLLERRDFNQGSTCKRNHQWEEKNLLCSFKCFLMFQEDVFFSSVTNISVKKEWQPTQKWFGDKIWSAIRFSARRSRLGIQIITRVEYTYVESGKFTVFPWFYLSLLQCSWWQWNSHVNQMSLRPPIDTALRARR